MSHTNASGDFGWDEARLEQFGRVRPPPLQRGQVAPLTAALCT